MIKKFLFNIGQMPKQTAPMSTITHSRGQYVLSIIEANIDKVLIGSKPVNKHIKNARKTLILMIDSLPEDSKIFKFILENIKTPYKLNATVSGNQISVNKEPWINLNLSPQAIFLF